MEGAAAQSLEGKEIGFPHLPSDDYFIYKGHYTTPNIMGSESAEKIAVPKTPGGLAIGPRHLHVVTSIDLHLLDIPRFLRRFSKG